MSKTQTISLGEYWNNYLEEELKIGRYSSSSEIIRDALRLFEEREAHSKLEIIRKALIEGEESGDAGKLNMNAIKKAAKNKLK